MNAFAWGVGGSVAGVAGVAATVVFGVVPLRQARRKPRLPSAYDAVGAAVPGGQGRAAGDARVDQFIRAYVQGPRPPAVAAGGAGGGR